MALYLPAAHGNPYSSFLARFRSELGAEHPSLLSLDFEGHLLDQVDTHEMLYLGALVSPPKPPHWHAIHWHDDRAQDGHHIEAAPNLEAGAAAVLQRLEEFDLSYTDWAHQGSSVTFAGPQGRIATVSPFAFSQAQPVIVERVRTALTGVRTYGEDGRLTARLHKIPGLDDLGLTSRGEKSSRLGYSVLASCKDISAGVRRACTAVGVELKNSRCQEAVAHAVGAKNWATLVAAEDTHPVPQAPYEVVLPAGGSGPRSEYLATGVEALARLATARAAAPDRRQPIYVTAAMRGGISLHPVVMENRDTETAGPLDVLDPDLDYLTRASSMLDSLKVRPNVVRLRRKPKPKPVKARIGNYALVIEPYGQTEHGLLTVTPVDQSGFATGPKRQAALYKANVVQTPKGLKLLADYEREVILDLDTWNPAQCAELFDFLGVDPEPHRSRGILGLMAHSVQA